MVFEPQSVRALKRPLNADLRGTDNFAAEDGDSLKPWVSFSECSIFEGVARSEVWMVLDKNRTDTFLHSLDG